VTPWLISPAHVRDCLDTGLDTREVLVAVHLAAFFNYLTRVADATGIELDYASPLPSFIPDRGRPPATRPAPRHWPSAIPWIPATEELPDVNEAWSAWRAYRLSGWASLAEDEREMLATVAAAECCDTADCSMPTMPDDRRSRRMQGFARKLSRAPWQTEPCDLASLRQEGLEDVDLLQLISVVAGQNADSRLRFGLAAARAARRGEARD
jgi:hypothetical protein